MKLTKYIGRALVGQMRWDELEVIEEQQILFGDDNKAARAFVNRMRANLLEGYVSTFELLRKKEKLLYGEKSYFYMKEHGGAPLPEDQESDTTSITDSIGSLSIDGGMEAGDTEEESDEDGGVISSDDEAEDEGDDGDNIFDWVNEDVFADDSE